MHGGEPGPQAFGTRREGLVAAGLVFMRIAAVLGAVVGGTAAVLANMRERSRKLFVESAEQGKIPGVRVDATPEGKALVRVSSLGQGYRVSDFTQEVFLLDEEGHATESRLADRA